MRQVAVYESFHALTVGDVLCGDVYDFWCVIAAVFMLFEAIGHGFCCQADFVAKLWAFGVSKDIYNAFLVRWSEALVESCTETVVRGLGFVE